MSALATYSRPAPAVRPSPLPSRTATSHAATPPAGSPYAAPASRYRDAELLAATPGQLVVLLFEKMLLTLRRGRLACEARRIEERCDLLLRAHDMIAELRVSLDHANGGDISPQLDTLYAYMQGELLAANRDQQTARIDVVIRMASELRDAFATVVAQLVVTPGSSSSSSSSSVSPGPVVAAAVARSA